MEKDIFERSQHDSTQQTQMEQIIRQILSEYSIGSELDEIDAERLERAVIDGVMYNLSIEELSDRCCCSLSTFKRRFHKHFNISPHRWILLCRLKLAKELLTSTDGSIADIAMQCGFVNNSHFIATFRRYYNITPLKYRRSVTTNIEPNK